MPAIPQYTAHINPQIPTGSAYIAPQDQTGARVAQQGQELAEKWVQITANLQAQQGDLEWLQAKADRDAGIENIKVDLSRDPKVIENPAIYQEEYITRVNQLEDVLRGQMQTRRGVFQFDIHTQRERPSEAVKARKEGLGLLENKLQGEFIVERDRLSKQAGESPNAQEYMANFNLFDDLLQKSRSRNLLNDAQVEEQRIQFRKNAAESNMRFIGDQSPSKMREMQSSGVWKNVDTDKKISIMDHVAVKERVAAEQQRAQTALITKAYVDQLEGQANFGNLSQELITRGQKGLDPLQPNPVDWNRLDKLNEDAPGLNADDAGGIRAIDSIGLSYDLLSEPNKESAQQALQELNNLKSQGGLSRRAIAHMTTVAKHIQGRIVALDAAELAAEKYDETTRKALKTEARADKNEVKSDINFEQSQNAKKVHEAMVFFDKEISKSIVSGPIFSARRAKQRAEFEFYMRQNPNADPKQALESIVGKPNERRPSILDPSLLRPR